MFVSILFSIFIALLVRFKLHFSPGLIEWERKREFCRGTFLSKLFVVCRWRLFFVSEFLVLSRSSPLSYSLTFSCYRSLFLSLSHSHSPSHSLSRIHKHQIHIYPQKCHEHDTVRKMKYKPTKSLVFSIRMGKWCTENKTATKSAKMWVTKKKWRSEYRKRVLCHILYFVTYMPITFKWMYLLFDFPFRRPFSAHFFLCRCRRCRWWFVSVFIAIQTHAKSTHWMNVEKTSLNLVERASLHECCVCVCHCACKSRLLTYYEFDFQNHLYEVIISLKVVIESINTRFLLSFFCDKRIDNSIWKVIERPPK